MTKLSQPEDGMRLEAEFVLVEIHANKRALTNQQLGVSRVSVEASAVRKWKAARWSRLIEGHPQSLTC